MIWNSPDDDGRVPKEYILRPASPLWVAASLGISLLLNIVLKRELWVPDFLALTLIFWTLRQPDWVGLSVAFFFGILMDVQQGSLLGQHALAYVILSYMSDRVSKRLSWFSPIAQGLHLLPLLLLTQVIVLIIRMWGVHTWPQWTWFLSSVFAVLLWPIWSWLLQIPQRKAKTPDVGHL